MARFDPKLYEKKAYPKRGGAVVSETEISDVVKMSHCIPGSLVLDVGMGTGRMARAFAGKGATVIGLDADSNMIRHFARFGSSKKPGTRNVDLVVATGQYLPFRRDTFDVIVCIRVLRYLELARKAIADMCMALKPRGRLVLEFANALRPQTIMQIPQLIRRGGFYPRLFMRNGVRLWVTSQGMRIIELHGWHKVPVEIMNIVNDPTQLRVLLHLESFLQKVLPAEFLSRSLILSASKH